MPSTVVKSYQYDPEKQCLRVTYTSGAVYDYFEVPSDVYTAMNAYQSKGTFLNRQIKGHYRFEKIS